MKAFGLIGLLLTIVVIGLLMTRYLPEMGLGITNFRSTPGAERDSIDSYRGNDTGEKKGLIQGASDTLDKAGSRDDAYADLLE